MPHNLPVSNKQDLKENSCVSFGAGSFTILCNIFLQVQISYKGDYLFTELYIFVFWGHKNLFKIKSPTKITKIVFMTENEMFMDLYGCGNS